MRPSEITIEFRLALGLVIPRSSIDAWWETPNAAFEGRTPAELIAAGETERLWQMIHELESGQPG